MTPPNFMVIGFQIGKLHRGGRNPPPRLYPILKSPACLGLKEHQDEFIGYSLLIKTRDPTYPILDKGSLNVEHAQGGWKG